MGSAAASAEAEARFLQQTQAPEIDSASSNRIDKKTHHLDTNRLQKRTNCVDQNSSSSSDSDFAGATDEDDDGDESGAIDSSINTTSAILDLNNNTCNSSADFASKHRKCTSTAPRNYSTRQTPSLFTSFFFRLDQASVLSKLVMSYEEQLQKAVEKGNYELCNELLLKSCSVNVPVNKKYPLCIACEENNYDICELLIKHGANVNQFDFLDQSCLIYALGSADLNVVQLLIKNGADLNRCDSNGFYPLHIAVTRQNDEICDYLLENPGINIDCVDK